MLQFLLKLNLSKILIKFSYLSGPEKDDNDESDADTNVGSIDTNKGCSQVKSASKNFPKKSSNEIMLKLLEVNEDILITLPQLIEFKNRYAFDCLNHCSKRKLSEEMELHVSHGLRASRQQKSYSSKTQSLALLKSKDKSGIRVATVNLKKLTYKRMKTTISGVPIRASSIFAKLEELCKHGFEDVSDDISNFNI